MKKTSFALYIILLFSLFFGGCKSTPSQKIKFDYTLRDSLFWSRKSIDSIINIPRSYATLVIQLDRLLPGDTQEKKVGQATVKVEKKEDGGIEVSATCDSLQFRIYLLEETLSSINEENKHLQEEIKTAPNKWNWFWKGFTLGVLIITIILLVRIFKK